MNDELREAVAAHYAEAPAAAVAQRQAALAAAFAPDPLIEEQLASAARDPDYAAEMERVNGTGVDRLSLSAYLDARRAAIAANVWHPKETT